jgi:hypothetical protein
MKTVNTDHCRVQTLAEIEARRQPDEREAIACWQAECEAADRLTGEHVKALSAAGEAAFVSAWRSFVQLAGIEFFGDGKAQSLARARSKWELQPNLQMIGQAGYLSPGQRDFLLAGCSFYNDSPAALEAMGATSWPSLCSLAARLDPQRRAALLKLIETYCGW